jgi:hypothetical protein
MRFDRLAFWRASLIFWIAALLYVVAMELLRHPYSHPVEILLPPIFFAILSASRLHREIRNRNGKSSS